MAAIIGAHGIPPSARVYRQVTAVMEDRDCLLEWSHCPVTPVKFTSHQAALGWNQAWISVLGSTLLFAMASSEKRP